MGRHRLLVVDDDEDVRALTQGMLRDVGHDVETASDGVDAIRRIEARRPDLVVLDLLMPRVDGWGVLEFLREHPDPPPVVLLTAHDDFDAFSRGLEAGVAGYVPKPLHFAELVKTCERVLVGAAPAAASGERRRHPRRSIVVAVTVSREDETAPRLGRLVDVSLGGAQVELDVPLPPGKRVTLSVRLSEERATFALAASVVWERRAGRSHLHGLSFVACSTEDIRRLRLLLSRRAPALAVFAVTIGGSV